MATTSSSTSSPPAPAPTLPCLVFGYGDDQHPATLFSVSDGARRACEIEELRGKRRSWPTSHGWVLTWDPDTTATFLWKWNAHDAAADKIALPALPQPPPPPWRSVCALSGSPTAGGAGTSTTWAAATAPRKARTCPAASASRRAGAGSTTATRPPSAASSTSRPRRPAAAGRRRSAPCPWNPCRSSTSRAARGRRRTCPSSRSTASSTSCPCFSTAPTSTPSPTSASTLYRKDFARREHVRVGSIGDRAILAGSGGRYLGRWCPATEFGLLPNSVCWMSAFDRRLQVFDIELGTEQVHEPPFAETSPWPFWMIPPHP
ncbi:unnamed protein product [Urochloa decumbens]|uniref:DUF295 domain-containing protein n=1 Tax=Urochloa decumbens TaxID=240449 RepID=A0ABC9E4H4_9POAL